MTFLTYVLYNPNMTQKIDSNGKLGTLFRAVEIFKRTNLVTDEGLAEKLGIARQTITFYRNGYSKIPAEFLQKLAVLSPELNKAVQEFVSANGTNHD